MHEMAIADSILRIALRHANGRRVSKLVVQIGHLRQVLPDPLAFGFEMLAVGTPLEGAQMVIESVPAAAMCRKCGATTGQPTLPMTCGACGAFELIVVQGEELIVESLEIEENENEQQHGYDTRDGARA
jgi:hydrogenase nickel incorporation protein HypA/HybF